MLEFTTKPDPAKVPKVPREELFKIDGSAYTIPERFRPLEMARFAHLVDTMGNDAAAMWGLQQALGDEGYLAFLNLPPDAVSEGDFRKVLGVVVKRLSGLTAELPKDGDSPGPESDTGSKPSARRAPAKRTPSRPRATPARKAT
jgi:hypothetical protein